MTPTGERDGVVELGLEGQAMDGPADRAFEPVGDLAAGKLLRQADVRPGAGQGGVEGRAGGRGRRSRARRGRASSRSASRAGPRRPRSIPTPSRPWSLAAGAAAGASRPSGPSRARRASRIESGEVPVPALAGLAAEPDQVAGHPERGQAGEVVARGSRSAPRRRRPAPGRPTSGRRSSASPAIALWRKSASAVTPDPRVGRRRAGRTGRPGRAC